MSAYVSDNKEGCSWNIDLLSNNYEKPLFKKNIIIKNLKNFLSISYDSETFSKVAVVRNKVINKNFHFVSHNNKKLKILI